jgi:hypothetical protein
MIDYTIATKLKDALLEHRELSDFHSIAPEIVATRIIHKAGLSTAYVPLAKTTRKDCHVFDMHLAVVDRREKPHGLVEFSTDPDRPTKVYSLSDLQPMTRYVGELMTCDLAKLWWAAMGFFDDMASILAPSWRCYSDHEGGRSGWGAQDRAAMARAFDEFWTPRTTIEPTVIVPPKKLRFTRITTLPLAPAAAGEN